ncbi:MAG: peptidase MA family metallohydrolase [Chloroflexota bacterium]
MNKKTLILLLALLISLAANLSPVQAQSGLAVLSNSPEAEFPNKLTFNLSAASSVDITDIRLCYTIDRASFAQVTSEVYVEFTPGTSISTQWTMDMKKTGGLPPGSKVTYWWRVTDASGNEVETAPAQVPFDDTRYPWRSLSRGKITLLWYAGNESFAQELLATAEQTLARLASDTGAQLKQPVKLYIYASTQDLRGSLIYPQEWTGGQAFTRFGIIAIGIAPSQLDWGKRATAHELAHLVTQQMTYNPYSGLPSWLNEGLSMYAEGPLGSTFVAQLDKATAENRLISVRSLSSPFSAFREESALAYAQSYRLIELLIASYGQAKMLELLNTFREGASYDGALERVYGFDMDGLDILWRESLTRLSRPALDKNMPTARFGRWAVPVGI